MSDSTSSGHPIPAALTPRAQPLGVNTSFRMFRCVTALMLREMSTRYGRNPGGYVWAFLEPLGMILMLSVVFSALVRTPPLGDNFMLFFATGFLPLQIYNSLNGSVARAINFSRALLFYPAITWVDAVTARFVLNLVTEVLVMMLLLISLIMIFDLTVLFDIQPVLLAIAMLMALGFGIGIMNSVLFGFFPVWMNIWSILNRPLFFISGILFVFEDMPAHIQTYLWYNPLIHVTGLMRTAFYPTYDANYASPLYVFAFAIIPSFFGILLMRRYHREILNR